MTYRATIRKVIYEAEGRYVEDAMPENLRDLIGWLQAKLDSLPEDMRDEAVAEIDASTYYDSAILEIKIEGRRPETDEEQAARLRAEADKKAGEAYLREIQERAAYEALKRKYGDRP